MKKTSLHDGHRDRLREKFIRHGLSSLEPHEVVELMLYLVSCSLAVLLSRYVSKNFVGSLNWINS